MYQHEHDIIQACYKIVSDMLAREKRPVQKDHLLRTKNKLHRQLQEPIEPLENTGEHYKSDNPFNL